MKSSVGLFRSHLRGPEGLAGRQRPRPSVLGGGDDPDLRDADPDTLRYRVWHLPARLARHARQRILAISADWPWAQAFLACWQRLTALPAPA